jgi:inhibitor of KinA
MSKGFDIEIVPLGDRGLLIQLEQRIDEEINQQVLCLAKEIQSLQIRGIEEIVPAFASLAIYYNPFVISYRELIHLLRGIKGPTKTATVQEIKRVVSIPVLYGGVKGPDLLYVAEYHGITAEEVIRLHTGERYRVYMLGFSPGFPYLGGLTPKLHTPRLSTPRVKVEAGSVGIAGSQTGIYSLSTPGGWRIIGHTPVPLFDPTNDQQPTLLQAGDYIRFESISEAEYEELRKRIETRTYQPVITEAIP